MFLKFNHNLSNLFSYVFIIFALLLPPAALAINFQKVDIDDGDFLLLDIRLQGRTVVSAMEAYGYNEEEQILLPLGQLITAFGGGIDIDADTGKAIITLTNNTYVVELAEGKVSTAISNTSTNFVWATDSFDIFVSHLLLEDILNAEFITNFSSLSMRIESRDLFPIELIWARQEDPKRIKSSAMNTAVNLYTPDNYQLFTTPTANVSLTMGANQEEDSLRGGYSIQTTSDLFYHSAKISLQQNTTSNHLTSRVNFTRHQPSPTEKLWGGFRNYSFGDVSISDQNLVNTSSSGLGITLANSPDFFESNFGTKNIEGDATPGWDVELYLDGYFIASKKVPANGHYLFEDVVTGYGNNHFETRLLGPLGEKEVNRDIVKIGSNWLPKGEFSYNLYLLDRNRTLLNKSSDDSSSFGTDGGFTVNFSLFDNTHIGSSVQQSQDSADINKDQKYISAHIQSAFSNFSLRTQFLKQLDHGHKITAQGIGRFLTGQSYQVILEDERDFSESTTPEESHKFKARLITTGKLPIFKGVRHNTAFNYTTVDRNELIDLNSFQLSSNLSWRLSSLNFSNSFSYSKTKSQELSTDSFTGSMLTSYKNQKNNITFRSTMNYSVHPDTQFDSVSLSIFKPSKSYRSSHAFRATYAPKKIDGGDNRWNASYIYNSRFDMFNISLTSEMNSDKEWNFDLGLNFFFDYDVNNNRFLISSLSNASTGNLDIISYLDRNNNDRRDEGDYTLQGIEFSPIPIWKGLSTNQQGKVALPGVPVYKTFNFSAASNKDITTKRSNFSIYTHPGSRLKIEIPFTIKTNLTGFIEVSDSNNNMIPLTTGTLEIINLKNDNVKSIPIDIDGYYEADIPPGNYQLKVKNEDLLRLKLVAKLGTLEFKTPAHGGYFELEPIVLLREKDASNFIPQKTLIDIAENGETFFFENRNLRTAPEQSNVVINGQNIENKTSSFKKQKRVLLLGPSRGSSDKTLQSEADNSRIPSNEPLESEEIETPAPETFEDDFIDDSLPLEPLRSVQPLKNISQVTPAVRAPSLSRQSNTNNFTIQLLAASQSSTIPAYIDRNKLRKASTFIIEKNVRGALIYVLNFGNYLSIDEAKEALLALPSSVQKSAWARKINN
jgi:hypothetical protein